MTTVEKPRRRYQVQWRGEVIPGTTRRPLHKRSFEGLDKAKGLQQETHGSIVDRWTGKRFV